MIEHIDIPKGKTVSCFTHSLSWHSKCEHETTHRTSAIWYLVDLYFGRYGEEERGFFSIFWLTRKLLEESAYRE